jgi:hypothetical protein
MTKPRPVRRRLATIPLLYKRWLLGRCGALDILEPARVRSLWSIYGSVVTERHARRHPFSRPRAWWKYTAPEPLEHGVTQRQYLLRHPELLFEFERPGG